MKMDEILMIEKPLKWDKFRNSNGWVIGFKKRFRISSQCLTNKKDIPIFQKLPRVQKFHRWLLLELQQQQPPRCPKYGFSLLVTYFTWIRCMLIIIITVINYAAYILT